MRNRDRLRVAAAALLMLSGCGPAVSERDLGKVHLEMPRVPGTEKPYELPELEGNAAAKSEEAPGHDHDHDHAHPHP